MREIYEFAIQLAEQAGENTLKYFTKNFEIESKADESPVTIADRSTEELIRQSIEKRFPDDAVKGEEFGDKSGSSGYCWIIDPIDGTKSFIRNAPLYGTLIAVEHNGAPLIGVMRFPPLRLTISAMKGDGCYANGQPCRVSNINQISQASLMTTDVKECVNQWGQDSMIKTIAAFKLHRTWGDCFGYYLLAAGKVEAMIDPKMQIWDVAPLIPIIQEAGGTITDVQGHTRLAMQNSIASNGPIHQELLNRLGDSNSAT